LPDRRQARNPLGPRLVTDFDRHGRYTLKTSFVGLCLLLFVTQATAAANGESTTTSATAGKAATKRPATPRTSRAVSLDVRLARKLEAAEKHRSVIRFFANHRSLLSAADHRPTARQALRRAKRNLARATRTIAAIRRLLLRREAKRKANAPPKAAICDVFGRRYCGEALSVSWCESRYSTRAANGQYLGLFQMGSYERGLYGHGSTARRQALAAHRYFVVTGRDWSPWSCKPSYSW
jgi:hypothetical protein